MFVKTVKVKSAVKVLAIIAAVAAVLALALGLINRFGLGSPNITLESEEAQREFLQSLGWEISDAPIDVKEVTIPKEWTSVYEEYNDLQKQQGFDLSRYKGEKVTVYTWQVTNYEGNPSVAATLMLKGDKLIAGDVQALELGGFMQGLVKMAGE